MTLSTWLTLSAPQSPQAYVGDDDEPNLAGSAMQQVLAEPLGPGGSGRRWGCSLEPAVREGAAIMTVRTATFIRPSARAGVVLSAGHWLTVATPKLTH